MGLPNEPANSQVSLDLPGCSQGPRPGPPLDALPEPRDAVLPRLLAPLLGGNGQGTLLLTVTRGERPTELKACPSGRCPRPRSSFCWAAPATNQCFALNRNSCYNRVEEAHKIWVPPTRCPGGGRGGTQDRSSAAARLEEAPAHTTFGIIAAGGVPYLSPYPVIGLFLSKQNSPFWEHAVRCFY